MGTCYGLSMGGVMMEQGHYGRGGGGGGEGLLEVWEARGRATMETGHCMGKSRQGNANPRPE